MDLSRCDVIKPDIEGMEMQAPEGARSTIMKHPGGDRRADQS
jgi:hypothetical protein